MKILRVAVKERCPHCGHRNEVDLASHPDGKMNCGSCGGYWDTYSTNNDDPKAFADPPARAEYGNPRGKISHTMKIYKLAIEEPQIEDINPEGINTSIEGAWISPTGSVFSVSDTWGHSKVALQIAYKYHQDAKINFRNPMADMESQSKIYDIGYIRVAVRGKTVNFCSVSRSLSSPQKRVIHQFIKTFSDDKMYFSITFNTLQGVKTFDSLREATIYLGSL